MKSSVKTIFRRLGYDIQKRTAADAGPRDEFIPFVRELDLWESRARFWIADAEAESWYRQEHLSQFAEIGQICRFAAASNRILEIGTHHAVTAVAMANALGKNGMVLGVEAHPQNAMVAQAQVALNGLRNKLEILHCGCTDVENGAIHISRDCNAAVRPQDSGFTIEVPAATADTLDAKHGPFDFLKIDVEGHEREVLRGAAGILKRRPRIALELHLGVLAGRKIDPGDVLSLIDLNSYEGTMVIRPDWGTLLPLDPARFPEGGNINLFLTPK